MRLQRTTYTAIIATLLWPVAMWVLKNPLIELMQLDWRVAFHLLTNLTATTALAVWCIDGFSGWSAGTTPPIGIQATALRFGIAFISAILFSIPYAMLISALTERPYGLVDAFMSQGVLIVGIVWLATQLVDFLVRDYKMGR